MSTINQERERLGLPRIEGCDVSLLEHNRRFREELSRGFEFTIDWTPLLPRSVLLEGKNANLASAEVAAGVRIEFVRAQFR
jgi:hypothetical protein